MEVFTNHTFQPGATIRRGELAQAVAQLLPLALAGRAAQLTQWQAARPSFPDVAASNLYYRAAAAGRDLGRHVRGRRRPLLPDAARDGQRSGGGHQPNRAAGEALIMAILTAANQLTMLRLLLVPVFALCMIYGRTGMGARRICCGRTDRCARWPDCPPYRARRTLGRVARSDGGQAAAGHDVRDADAAGPGARRAHSAVAHRARHQPRHGDRADGGDRSIWRSRAGRSGRRSSARSPRPCTCSPAW